MVDFLETKEKEKDMFEKRCLQLVHRTKRLFRRYGGRKTNKDCSAEDMEDLKQTKTAVQSTEAMIENVEVE
mgnify:CR=1 FL=1